MLPSLLIIPLSLGAQTLHWQRVDWPYGANVISLAARGETIFVGRGWDSGGIFRSVDHGDTWRQLDTGLPRNSEGVFAPISVLAVSGTRVFAGTGDFPYHPTLFRSSDNGGSWTEAVERGYPASVLFVSGTTLFAGTRDGGLYRSTDDGDSWTNTNLDGWYINALAAGAASIFAGTDVSGQRTGRGGVYRSTDNGESWSHVTGDPGSPNVLALAAYGTTIFAGTPRGPMAAHGRGMAACFAQPITAIRGSMSIGEFRIMVPASAFLHR